jgi:hypothetical protein
MSLEITGKIVKLLDVMGGTSARGEWKKQSFVIETQETYPKKVCITCWNEKLNDLSKYSEGQMVKVSFNAESREFQNKWYTDLTAWRIESSSATSGNNNNAANTEDNGFSQDVPTVEESQDFQDDLPF